MITLICGGNIKTGRPSKIVQMISNGFDRAFLFNGTVPERIDKANLTIWMPDIGNEVDKKYPKKRIGSVLICSKVMRTGYTDMDAISRIFKMNGNGVIKVYRDENPFKFQLTDALGNNWTGKTDNIQEIVQGIKSLYYWTEGSIRKSLKHGPGNYTSELSEDFVQIIRRVAEKAKKGIGTRFFGNYSTRCTKLFPSERRANGFLFSPRNVNKESIESDDCVYCEEDMYFGDRKPSVDTPVQIEVYKAFPDINYIIHGHAFIKNRPTTRSYFPCGDLREVNKIVNLIYAGHSVMNLLNHGFLITGSTVKSIENIVECSEFTKN